MSVFPLKADFASGRIDQIDFVGLGDFNRFNVGLVLHRIRRNKWLELT